MKFVAQSSYPWIDESGNTDYYWLLGPTLTWTIIGGAVVAAIIIGLIAIACKSSNDNK